MFANAAQRTPASYCSVSQRRRRDVAVQRVVRRHRAFFQAFGVARVERQPLGRVHRRSRILEPGIRARLRQHARSACRPILEYDVFCRPTLISPTSAHCSSYAAPKVCCFTSSCDCSPKTNCGRAMSRPTPSCTGPTSIDVFAAVATLLQPAARGELQRVPALACLEHARQAQLARLRGEARVAEMPRPFRSQLPFGVDVGEQLRELRVRREDRLEQAEPRGPVAEARRADHAVVEDLAFVGRPRADRSSARA